VAFIGNGGSYDGRCYVCAHSNRRTVRVTLKPRTDEQKLLLSKFDAATHAYIKCIEARKRALIVACEREDPEADKAYKLAWDHETAAELQYDNAAKALQATKQRS
jgi:hypothetical protein